MRYLVYLIMIVALATLIPWLPMAPMSLMAFDDGFNAPAIALVGGFIAYPIWLLSFLYHALKQVRAGNEGRALMLAIVAMLPALLVLGVMGYQAHLPDTTLPRKAS